MKKNYLIVIMMCVMSPNCKAQIGAYDNGIQLPVTDLYDMNMMQMALQTQRETAAMISYYFTQCTRLAIDAYKSNQFVDAINYANYAIKLRPEAPVFYLRGLAFEAIGQNKEALTDYKRAKKENYAPAFEAHKQLKAKMKKMRKK